MLQQSPVDPGRGTHNVFILLTFSEKQHLLILLEKSGNFAKRRRFEQAPVLAHKFTVCFKYLFVPGTVNIE